jgi:cytochrome c peroxidase
MFKKYLLLISIVYNMVASEPISPIPESVDFDYKKAKLGQALFFTTLLSKDNSVSCLSCHNIYDGGADSNPVSIGFAGKKGNIQSPTVFNARYNFRQFWNGRAKDLKEQADGPLNNPVEHNMNPKSVVKALEGSKEFRKKFYDVYKTSRISYDNVLDAIVEFEKALITPNSKFDKYLRGEIKLSENEKEGYILFKQNGCITCHNGINIGANSFQKMGTFIEYKTDKEYPDRSKVNHNPMYKNVFKVPTLRNISKTAPYFHNASANTLKDAINTMTKYNLGVELTTEEVSKIESCVRTLDGELPKILEEK